MNERCLKFRQWCQNFDQWIKFGVLFLFGATLAPAWAFQGDHTISLKSLNPYAKIRTRKPTNFVPNDDVEPIPFEERLWVQDLLIEDNAGVLSSIRNDFKTWEEKEEYVRNWNLESTGIYVLPSDGYKKSYLMKKLLRYADKRLAGEIRNAEKGTAMARIGEVHKALRPKAEASISKHIKLRFKARVLQGKAIILVDNPYVEYETNVNAAGRVNMHMKKNIKSLGVETGVDYNMHEGNWVARVDRPLTDEVRARVSSSQTDKEMAFTGNADKKVELLYNRSF